MQPETQGESGARQLSIDVGNPSSSPNSAMKVTRQVFSLSGNPELLQSTVVRLQSLPEGQSD